MALNEIPKKLPRISNERLKALLNQAGPVMLTETGEPVWMVKPDPRKTAYTWGPTRALRFRPKLVELGKLYTLHTWGYYGFFKPSMAEVLAEVDKLPADVRDQVAAFHTKPRGEVEGTGNWRETMSACGEYHVGVTTLWRKA